jgi:Condensation domain
LTWNGCHERMKQSGGVKTALRNFFRSFALHESCSPAGKIFEIPDADHYPLTANQKRLYILNRIEGFGVTGHLPGRLTSRGALDSNRLAKALHTLVDRHEALRTGFPEINGEPVQVVMPSLRLAMRFEESTEALLPEIEKRFVRPFSLSKAPLFRVLLVRTAPDLHHLLLDVHQIVADALSLDTLLHELHHLMSGASLPEPGVRLRDYAVWEQQFRKSAPLTIRARLRNPSRGGATPSILVRSFSARYAVWPKRAASPGRIRCWRRSTSCWAATPIRRR